jgi:hypothetical protein
VIRRELGALPLGCPGVVVWQSEPRSMLQSEASSHPANANLDSGIDYPEHARTYRSFVTGVFLFAAHVLVILLVLAWVFSASFGTAQLPG